MYKLCVLIPYTASPGSRSLTKLLQLKTHIMSNWEPLFLQPTKSLQQLVNFGWFFFVDWFLEKPQLLKNPKIKKKKNMGILKKPNWGGDHTPDLTNLRMTFLAKTKFEDYLSHTSHRWGEVCRKLAKNPWYPIPNQQKKTTPRFRHDPEPGKI